MKRLLPSLIFLLAASSSGFACQFTWYTPYKFIDSEFVFLGEVIGHTDPVDFIRHRELPPNHNLASSLLRSSGLIVKLTDDVFVPQKETAFEIFSYGLGSMCETLGVDKVKLQEDWPVGTRVMVVARKARQVPERSDGGRMRLEITHGGLLGVNVAPDLTSTSVYDFKTLFQDSDNKWHWRGNRITFEIRKELFRLEYSEQKTKGKILDRLFSIPFKSVMIDLYEVATRQSSSAKKAENRFIKKLRREGFSEEEVNSFVDCKRSEKRDDSELYSGSRCYIPRLY